MTPIKLIVKDWKGDLLEDEPIATVDQAIAILSKHHSTCSCFLALSDGTRTDETNAVVLRREIRGDRARFKALLLDGVLHEEDGSP